MTSYKPKLTQEQAINIVINDLKKLHPEFKQLYILDEARHNYIPLAQFKSTSQKIPLIYAHPNNTIMLIDTTTFNSTSSSSIKTSVVWYQCDDDPHYPYCGFVLSPQLDYRGRLIYGVDVDWIGTRTITNSTNGTSIITEVENPDIYAVDANTGKILDSLKLRQEAK